MFRTPARFLLRLAALALVACATFAGFPAIAAAAQITVNTTADEAPFPGECQGVAGDCSLRQALNVANNASEPDTIVLPAGTYNLTIKGSGENEGMTGDLDVFEGQEVAIQGAGARTTVINATGLEDRAFDVLSLASLSLSKLTVTGGLANGENGGGIRTGQARLILDQVAVRGNVSSKQGRGGGIAAEESIVTISNSLIAENKNSGDGGGLWLSSSKTSMINTTIADNVTDTGLYPGEEGWGAYGGAMEISGGFLGMQNVTIAGNSIIDNNGGEGGSGAAISGSPKTAAIVNTIVAGNSGTKVNKLGQCDAGPLLSEGHNLETQTPAGEPRCFEGSTDLVANPLLGALANNGGETDTTALLEGSPAINAADPAHCPATDQRGVTRPQLGGCDIGAFEFVPAPPPPPVLKPTIRRHGKVRVKASGKTFLVKPGFSVSCPAGGERCSGKIKATKKGVIGKKKFTVAPGKAKKLSLKLNAKGAKLLRQLEKLRAKFEVTARAGSGEPVKAKATLKLKLPSSSKK